MNNNQTSYDIIDFSPLSSLMRRYWVTIFLCSFIGTALGVASLHILPKQYRASLTVMESDSHGLGTVGGAGIAAGISLPLDLGFEEGSNEYRMFKDLIRSRPVSAELVKKPQLMQALFRREWDASTGNWQKPRGLAASISRGVKFILNRDDWTPPNEGRVAQYLNDNLSVKVDRDSQFLTISLIHRNPELALSIVSDTYKYADTIVRESVKKKAEIRAAYLRERIRKENMVENRLALGTLLAQNEKVLSIITEEIPYAADIVRPASLDVKPAKPNPKITLFLSTLFGAIFGLALAILFNLRQNR